MFNHNHDIELIRVVTAGSVDDGKSTLIGRLLYDCDAIYEDQLLAVEETSRKRGLTGLDLSLLTDGLASEREQGITIDVAYRYFSRPKRRFIIADVPGHEQYTRNMVTGASNADLALILVDAKKGLLIQSKRHLFVASILAVPHILILVNKMDLVDYRQDIFRRIKKNFGDFAAKLSIHDLQFIPISALAGDMVVNRGENMPWYTGATLLSYLDNTEIAADRNLIDFRFPVQCVIRSGHGFRGYAGRVEGGIVKTGEKIKILPSGQESCLKSILVDNEKRDFSFNPQSAVLTLADELDISRGDMIVRANNLPEISSGLSATICWFSDMPLEVDKSYAIKQTTKMTRGKFSRLYYKINMDDLHRQEAVSLALNEIGRADLQTSEPLFFDSYGRNRNTGSFIIIDELTNSTVGAGIILNSVKKIDAAPSTAQDRRMGGHKGFVLWFTGLSGSGKSAIADRVYEILQKDNVQSERLDGDIVRENLTRDLGFSREDREENIRRVGFVAELLSRHGVGVLASFISPYRKQREELRAKIKSFIEVFVDAPLAICEQRDPKGMYKKARAGEIELFTGISDSYEKPKNPQIHLSTHQMSIKENAAKIIKYLKDNGFIF